MSEQHAKAKDSPMEILETNVYPMSDVNVFIKFNLGALIYIQISIKFITTNTKLLKMSISLLKKIHICVANRS